MSLLTDLISYWKLDEASGNAIDAHGSNDLTEVVGTIGTASGKINGARDFELAETECLRQDPANASLKFGDEDFSIAAWVNLESLPATGVQAWIVSCGAVGTTSRYALFVRNFGGTIRFRFNVYDGSAVTEVVEASVGTPSIATWYHAVAWHDSVNNQIGIAVNATAAATLAHSTGVDATGNRFQLGANEAGTPGSVFDGLIDEVGIWGRVLTSQERTDLYNSGSGLAYESFGGGTVVPALDQGMLVGGLSTLGGGLI